MHVHRDRAVDIEALQDAPLGRIQRRPVRDIVLNIDRHQPQQDRGRVNRRPRDRDRLERQRALRREARLLEQRPRREPRQVERAKTVMPNPDSDTSQDLPDLQTFVLAILCAFTSMLLVSVLFFYVFVPYVEFRGRAIYSNSTTDMILKARLNQVNHLVAFYDLIYACSIVARVVSASLFIPTRPVPLQDIYTPIYRYLSLGSYAAALLLALTCGHVIYELTSLATLITSDDAALYVGKLCSVAKDQMVLGCFFEWAFGWWLYVIGYRCTLRSKITAYWAPTIPGIATGLVNVWVLMIYYGN